MLALVGIEHEFTTQPQLSICTLKKVMQDEVVHEVGQRVIARPVYAVTCGSRLVREAY